MPQGYVFVVTYGRSGSTLLQKILNSIDGYKILGENNNALMDLFKACEDLRKTREMWPKNDAPLPWLGAGEINVDWFTRDVVNAFIKHVLRPDPTTRIAGFKEIRFPTGTDAEMLDYIRFVEKSFPNTKTIFNIRKAADVARSSWWQEAETNRVLEMVGRMDAFFRRTAAYQPKFRYVVDYDAYVQDPTQLEGLFEFLGETMDQEKIKEILGVRLDHK